ncbi:MAG: ferritin family protein [Planctomycetes bacterium]|nr:ferritin family protein [Planctomycetota bacterium]MBL7144898.1 ferritin family protein [Phycisphaerae bacterium]
MTNIFEYAMQMEKDGEDYYRRLAQKTGNNGMKTILIMLADEEVKHYNALEKIKTQKTQIAESEILTDAKNVFVQIKESGESFDFDIKQTELYKKAQDIEKKSRDFYKEKANEVTEEYQKELFLKLADEENKHYLLLDNIIDFVSRPEQWLEDAEFFHLEDY